MKQGSSLVGAGLLGGLLIAAAVRKVATGLVFGVTPGDPLTYLLAASVFAAVALAAVMIPAHRATRVEPVRALRCD